jgi:PTS system glucose-specific IIA component
MISFLKKRKPTELYSPVVGKSIRIEDVSDPMFSQKMIGDGSAFIFDGDTVFSPCNAKVILFVDTKHAIGLDANGVEILLHIGIDTVNLKGRGFSALVSVGDYVKKGDPLLRIDRDFMKEENADLTTMMVITSKDTKFSVKEQGIVDLDTPVMFIQRLV